MVLEPPASGLNLVVKASGTGLGGIVTLGDLKDGYVNKSITNSISDASLRLSNFQGKWTGSVSVGNELRVDIGRTNPPTTRIFTGVVTSVIYSQDKGTKHDMLDIQAQDYGLLMKNVTATEDFVNLEVGSIVKSLVAFYTPQITVTNVNTTARTLSRFVCKKKTVFDLISELGEQVNYHWFVDTNKDLHFEPLQREQTTVASQPVIIVRATAFASAFAGV